MSTTDFDTPEWRAFLELSDAWQDLLTFMHKPKNTQLRIGRSMRHQAGKGAVAQIPVCVRCGSTSVLTVCRRCASPKQLAGYPALDAATFTTGKQTNESNKPPSKALIESLHAWAREHRPDLDGGTAGSGTGSTGGRTQPRQKSTTRDSVGEPNATQTRGDD